MGIDAWGIRLKPPNPAPYFDVGSSCPQLKDSTLSSVRMHIGILGGTFDPPHIGHLLAATHAREALGLDEVQLVVANDPWQKTGTGAVSAASHRLEMVRAAVEGYQGLVASDVEIVRGGPSYTIDTVLQVLGDGALDVHIIVGRDAAADLDTWHKSDELRELITVAIVDRPGITAEPPPGWRTCYVSVPQVDVSSTDLRCRLAAGDPVDVLIPPRVLEYLDRVELYPPST